MSKIKLSTLAAMLLLSAMTYADEAEDLARAAQNPIAAMISVPIQWNTYFETGPLEKPLHVMNIQPVIPVKINEQWNLITRTILPFVSSPGMFAGQDRVNGFGDMQLSLFLSPAAPLDSGWIVGAGLIGQFDTHSDQRLNSGGWGLGPTAVALRSSGAWTYGALVNNVWSDGNNFLIQPFANYNIPSSPGTYINMSPIITANWDASSDQKWTVPVGIGIGQIAKIGGQAINAQLGAYYNVERPDYVSPWMVRLQLQFLFPK